MRHSMTGFASAEGAGQGLSWSWDLRGVNGKGLDLRLRLPDWIEGLEQGVRARLQKRLARGNVSVSLKVTGEAGAGRLAINEAALADVLAALGRIEAEARVHGVSVTAPTGAEILALRGVLEETQSAPDRAALCATLLEEFDQLLEAFLAARAAEGAALTEILDAQLTDLSGLVDEAAIRAEARRDAQSRKLATQLARVLDNTDGVDETRIAQELALIAVKADVTEEIDRLRAHIASARAMLRAPGAVGKKLDFLMQEFNREANTLCSKAQSTSLTEVGLELKTRIDQMREQVQNVE